VVVLFIAASAVVAAVEAIRRLADPRDIDNLGIVAVAGLVGFVGNELVARYRISVGRRIGSAALVADGLHARTDGFTSLGVVLGAAGVALGFEQADPLIGLLITLAVLAVLRDAARDVYRRLMDAVDPELVDTVEATARRTPGVLDVGDVRLRWIGHTLRAEIEIVVDPQQSLVEAHEIAEATEHQLLHDVPRLHAALVHADPAGHPHDLTGHHRPSSAGDPE
jgi:cation diffusion facilitator family transporter